MQQSVVFAVFLLIAVFLQVGCERPQNSQQDDATERRVYNAFNALKAKSTRAQACTELQSLGDSAIVHLDRILRTHKNPVEAVHRLMWVGNESTFRCAVNALSTSRQLDRDRIAIVVELFPRFNSWTPERAMRIEGVAPIIIEYITAEDSNPTCVAKLIGTMRHKEGRRRLRQYLESDDASQLTKGAARIALKQLDEQSGP